MRKTTLLLLALLTIGLSGCAMFGKREVTKVQVPVACIKPADRPNRPARSCGVGQYPGDKTAAQACLRDLESLDQYATLQDVLLTGCMLGPAQ